MLARSKERKKERRQTRPDPQQSPFLYAGAFSRVSRPPVRACVRACVRPSSGRLIQLNSPNNTIFASFFLSFLHSLSGQPPPRPVHPPTPHQREEPQACIERASSTHPASRSTDPTGPPNTLELISHSGTRNYPAKISRFIESTTQRRPD